MGSTCAACSDSCGNGTDANTQRNKRKNAGEDIEGRSSNHLNSSITYHELSSDDERNASDDAAQSSAEDIDEDSFQRILSDDAIEGAFESWKSACEQGNETLVRDPLMIHSRNDS